MPIHAHDAAKGLKPEGIAQPGQKCVMPIMEKNALNDRGSHPRHTLGQPGRNVAAMKGRIGKSGSLHNLFSHLVISRLPRTPRAARERKFSDSAGADGSRDSRYATPRVKSTTKS